MNSIKSKLDTYFKTNCEIDGDRLILFSWIAIQYTCYGLVFYNCIGDNPYHQTSELNLIDDIKKELLVD